MLAFTPASCSSVSSQPPILSDFSLKIDVAHFEQFELKRGILDDKMTFTKLLIAY